MNVISKLETEKEASNRWTNRRRMAWITFIFDHLLFIYILIAEPNIGAYESLFSSFLILSGTIIGAYIGFSTWDDVNKKNAEADVAKTAIDNSAAYAITLQEDGNEK